LRLFITDLYQISVKQGKKVVFATLAALLLAAACSNTPANTPIGTPTPVPTPTPSGQHYNLSVTIVPSGAGAVAVSPSGDQIAPGTTVTLIAMSMEGHVFDHWNGDASGASSQTSVVMDSDKEITAYFIPLIPEATTKTSVDAVKSMLDGNESFVLIDVRPIIDFDRSHIPGAISIPSEELETRYGEISLGSSVVVYAACY